MNNSLKGALLSGLVFPGLGQIILKHHTRGIAFIIIVSVSLFVGPKSCVLKTTSAFCHPLDRMLILARNHQSYGPDTFPKLWYFHLILV